MVMTVVVNDVGSFMLWFAFCLLRFLEISASKFPYYKFSWNPCNSFSLSESKGKCSNVAVSVFLLSFSRKYPHIRLRIVLFVFHLHASFPKKIPVELIFF